LLAESVGVALLVILETLDRLKRLAFVLHDMFAVPFDEIAPIVGRSRQRHDNSPAALAAGCRARRRSAVTERRNQRTVVDRFLAASTRR